jgi:hypothetical protein
MASILNRLVLETLFLISLTVIVLVVMVFYRPFVCFTETDDPHHPAAHCKNHNHQSSLDMSAGLTACFTIISAVVFCRSGTVPLELGSVYKINAMIFQVYLGLVFVPLVLHGFIVCTLRDIVKQFVSRWSIRLTPLEASSR